jgi:hypothetical protein
MWFDRRVLVYSWRLEYLIQMSRTLGIVGSSWCKWIFRLALISFVGLYSIGLLPHKHAAAIPDELNCPVCHAVNGLTKLSASTNSPGLVLAGYVFQLLLVLPWVALLLVRSKEFPSSKRARAPPRF